MTYVGSDANASSSASPTATATGLTPLGWRVAVLFTKAHGRVLTTGLGWLDPTLPVDVSQRSPLAKAWRQLDATLDQFISNAMIAA